jgi:ParB/RepB/Spo0J family partition protein
MRITEARRSSLELVSPQVPLPDLTKGERVEDIPINSIIPNRKQVRKHFPEESIQELADSIKANKIQSPLIIRKLPESLVTRLSENGGGYELISGERRWRALKLLGSPTAPCIVREVEDSKMRILALIENVHREDLTLMDKAASILDLKAEIGSIDNVAISIHKSRGYTFKLARIGELAPEIQNVIVKSGLSMDEADEVAGLLKEIEKLGDAKVEYTVKRSLLDKPVDAKAIAALRERFLKANEKARGKSSQRSADLKTYWKTKREYGLKLRLPTANLRDTQAKGQLAKEAKRFFEAIGAKKVEISF